MKMLPTRPPDLFRSPSPPAPTASTVARGSVSVRSGLRLEAGVIVVALAGMLFALGPGRYRLGPWSLALYATLGILPVLAAALLAPRVLRTDHRIWLHRGALLAVLLAGAVLRFRGLGWSLPFVPHPDEPAVVNIAQRILVTGDLNPRRFIYPSLYIYLQAAVYVPHLLWGFAQGTYARVGDLPATTDIITTAPGIYRWGRALTAALATGTIALTYGAGRRLYGPGVGLVAALLLVFIPPAITDAHYITVDPPSAFFVALAFYWIVRLYRAPRTPTGVPAWGTVTLAGVGVGLAAATKYNAAAIAVPLLLVPLLRPGRDARGALRRVWLGGVAAAAATFLLTTPFAIPELPRFLNDTASVITHYKFEGHGEHTSDHNWRYYAGYLWESTRGTFALALGGLLVLAFRHRRADLLVLAFPLLYYGALAGLRVNFERNLMPLYPFLALAGAVSLFAAARWAAALPHLPRHAGLSPAPGRVRGAALVALAALPLVLVGPAATAGRTVQRFASPDPRVAAQRWMEENLPRNGLWLVQLPPQQWRATGHVVSTRTFGPLTRHRPAWYPEHGFGYLLLNRDDYGQAVDDPANNPAEVAWYDEALTRFRVVRTWPATGRPRLTLLDTGLGEPAMQRRDGARFGPGEGELALLGHNLGPAERSRGFYFPDRPGDPPRPLRPGDTLGLTLLWQALRPPAGDYLLFVHLRDPTGQTVAQRDTRPQNDTYPTTGWRAGELVLDSGDLALPATLPPGRYTVVLGLYPRGGSRLPVRPTPDAAPLPRDELPLATVEVRP